MTIQVTLTPDLESRLRREAERQGLAPDAAALQLLDKHLPPLDRQQAAALAMLQRWVEDDATLSPEEAAANAGILRALDADRPSHRKLFGDLQRGVPC